MKTPDNINLIKECMWLLCDEWERTVGNLGGDTYHNPFQNTSGSWENDTFKVKAYNWVHEWTDRDLKRVTRATTNFWYRDIRIRWTRDICRIDGVNRSVSNDELREMLDACLASLDRMDPGDIPMFTGPIPIPKPKTPWKPRVNYSDF